MITSQIVEICGMLDLNIYHTVCKVWQSLAIDLWHATTVADHALSHHKYGLIVPHFYYGTICCVLVRMREILI